MHLKTKSLKDGKIRLTWWATFFLGTLSYFFLRSLEKFYICGTKMKKSLTTSPLAMGYPYLLHGFKKVT
jgi:hypothetical protein